MRHNTQVIHNTHYTGDTVTQTERTRYTGENCCSLGYTDFLNNQQFLTTRTIESNILFRYNCSVIDATQRAIG